MSQHKAASVHVLSRMAHYLDSDKKRPSSHRRMSQKADIIEDIYVGTEVRRPSSAKRPPSKSYHEANALGTSALTVGLARSKEDLEMESLQLKKTINSLNEQIVLMKKKMESSRRQSLRYEKDVGFQFQKEAAWKTENTQSSHLITGIKHQYELLKEKYEAKCAQCQELLRTPTRTQLEEKDLQVETLMAHLQAVKLPGNHFHSLKMSELKEKLREKNEQIATLTKKLQVCEKGMLVVENELHILERKNKALLKDCSSLQSQVSSLNGEVERLKGRAEYISHHLKKQQDLMLQKTQQMFKQTLRKKEAEITQLTSELQYLATLLQHIQPKENNVSIYNESRVRGVDHNSAAKSFISALKDQTARKPSLDNLPLESSMLLPNTHTNIQGVQLMLQLNSKVEPDNPPFQSSVSRRSENAVRKRPVQARQVEGIAELIRYRLIGQSISLPQAQKLFEYTSTDDLVGIKESQFITMAETQKILSSSPFSLNAQDAELFSRYLIEDSPNEWVYCDHSNENSRRIVQSILKTSVGQYSSSPDTDALWKEAQGICLKYEANLKPALQSMCSSVGVISKKKFCDLFPALAIEITQEQVSKLIGKLSLISPNLLELKYLKIFEVEQPK